MLIIVIQAGVLFLGGQVGGWIDESGKIDVTVNEFAIFATTTGLTLLGVMWLMLELGFMATAYREGCVEQQPTRLIIEGRIFFWRVFRFQIMLVLAQILLSQTILNIVGPMVFGVEKMTEIPKYFPKICMLAADLALVKFLILAQAIIIIDNCNVMQAIKRSWQHGMFGFRWLIIAFMAGNVFAALIPTALGKEGSIGMGVSVFSGIYSLAVGAFMFIITLAALGYVASTRERSVEVDTETAGE